LRHAPGTEAGVEYAVGVIARDSEILNSSVLGDSESSCDDPAIGLKRGRARPIKFLISKVAVHFSSHAECHIDSAITEITHSGEVVEARRIIGGANRDNLSVGLDQNRKGIVFEPDKISCDLAATTKCGVRGSIRVVTRQRKIGIGRLARIKATKMVLAAMILLSVCKATSNA
jgi:hypothetical protein